MNENINLCEILKGLEGNEFYCSLIGKYVTLNTIYDGNLNFPLLFIYKIENRICTIQTTKEGTYFSKFPEAECVIFPDKNQRDWSKFERPIKEGIPVMVSDDKQLWILKFYKKYEEHIHYVMDIDTYGKWRYNYVILFDKFDPNNIEKSLKYNIQK